MFARDATAGGCLGLRSFFFLYRPSAFSATHARCFGPYRRRWARETLGMLYFNLGFK